MKVRTLNSAGIRLMERHLDSIRAGTEEKSTLDALITDAAYSAPTSTRIEVTKKSSLRRKISRPTFAAGSTPLDPVFLRLTLVCGVGWRCSSSIRFYPHPEGALLLSEKMPLYNQCPIRQVIQASNSRSYSRALVL